MNKETTSFLKAKAKANPGARKVSEQRITCSLPFNKESLSYKSCYGILFPHCLWDMMDYSIQQDLIESDLPDEESYYSLRDDDKDESRFIHVLNAVLSGTARLNVLLPTATILAFTIFAPLLTDDGKCGILNRWLMGVFLAISSASCIFFLFTDSFRTARGRLYYGVATFRGIWSFNGGGRRKPCAPSEYRLGRIDLFHASLSLIAFLTFAISHNDVMACYHLEMPRKVTNSVPLVVGFVISVLFVVFPSKRRGIGYPFLLHKDPLYTRN